MLLIFVVSRASNGTFGMKQHLQLAGNMNVGGNIGAAGNMTAGESQNLCYSLK